MQPSHSVEATQYPQSLDQLLRDAEHAHGHLCAGQVLGVRMAMFGLELLGIKDPRGADRKRLVNTHKPAPFPPLS